MPYIRRNYSHGALSSLFTRITSIGLKSRPYQKFSGAIFRSPMPHFEARLLNNISTNAGICYGPESSLLYRGCSCRSKIFDDCDLDLGNYIFNMKRECNPFFIILLMSYNHKSYNNKRNTLILKNTNRYTVI